jgi:hypothetical protein
MTYSLTVLANSVPDDAVIQPLFATRGAQLRTGSE